MNIDDVRQMMRTDDMPTMDSDFAWAAGMLRALRVGHACGEACTGQVTLPDGHVIELACPYDRLDPESPADRKIIASMYAHEALAAMGRD